MAKEDNKHVAYKLGVTKQQGLVSATAEHHQLTVELSKADCCNCRRVVVKCLNEAVFVINVKDVHKTVTACCCQ